MYKTSSLLQNSKYFDIPSFLKELNDMFHNLVEITEPMCHEINSHLVSILISDANPNVKMDILDFIFYIKSNIVTNSLGVVRHIDFYDEDMDFTSSPKPIRLSLNLVHKYLINVLYFQT